MLDWKYEYKLAQQSLCKGAMLIVEAGMRLQGSKYENEYKQIWRAIRNLNSSLISEVKRRE